MSPDLERLHVLGREWAALDELRDGMTPQQRGRRFNGLLAEMLVAWGIEARSDQRGLGEIDVIFKIRDQRFLLEAKWESHKTDLGAVSKLRTRVTQRLAGVLGIFVSIAGYTDETLDGLVRGQRSEVLLLGRQHVEAMLTGAAPPEELLAAVLDHAFYTGEPAASVLQVLPSAELPVTGAKDMQDLLVGEIIGVSVPEVVVWADGLPEGGFSLPGPGRLLMACGGGVVEIDTTDGRISQRASLSGLAGSPLESDGAVYVARRHAVVAVRDGEVRAVAGPLPGRITVFRGPDNRPWALANGGADAAPFICRIDGIGSEERLHLPVGPGLCSDAVALTDGTIAVSSRFGTLTVDWAGRLVWRADAAQAASNEDGITQLPSGIVLVAADGGELRALHRPTRSSRRLASVPLPDSGHALAADADGTVYLSCPLPTSGQWAVVRFRLQASA